LDHPAILHVYTKKGKGFSPAADAPRKFHSTGPFEINEDSIEPTSNGHRRSFTDVFGEHLVRLAEKDSRIVAITSAMCDGTGLVEFRKRFGDRFYDVGIAESAAVDIAAGMAKSGLKPLVAIYSTFLQRGFDQIFQEVALQNLPVVFCVDRAGVVGSDGPTHHGLMDVGFLRMMPNMVLTAPSDEVEMKLVLEFAFEADRPIVIRYPKDVVPSDEFDRSACTEPFELGKSVVVKSSPNSVIAIVAYGSLLTEALAAAKLLYEDGVEVDVINGRFAAPIDERIVSLLAEGKGIITVEDHRLSGGFGSGLLELAATTLPQFKKTTRRKQQAKYKLRETRFLPVTVLGVPNRFVRHGTRSNQLMDVGVNADKIVRTVKEMLSAVKA